jgi:uncharacterized protein
MIRVLQFILMLGSMILMIFLIHFYLLKRICSTFKIRYTKRKLLLTIFIVLCVPGSVILSRMLESTTSRLISAISFTYLGILMTVLSVFLLTEVLRLFIKSKKALKQFILIVSLVLVMFSFYSALTIVVEDVNIYTDRVSDNTSIVLLTDIHLDALNKKKLPNKIVPLTNELNPDFVFITGDLVDSSDLTQSDFDWIANINAPVFFVNGNHESHTGIRDDDLLENAKMVILKDRTVEFNTEFTITGRDYGTSRNVSTLIDDLDKERFNILLSHVPITFEDISESNIDLVLSGHTHAGQLFPFNLIVGAIYPLNHGLYQENNQSVYVSPGTGTWGPTMRLGSTSEITHIHLLKK